MTVDFIAIGEIVAPHGYRGTVRVLPLTDFPERFLNMNTAIVFSENRKRVYTIESAERHKQFILLKFAEVDDMAAAERLRGHIIKVPREETMPLPAGHYYIFDIVGLKVWSEEGALLGEVNEVFQTGANDVYSILRPDGKEILIPALKEVVREIDIPGGRMVVKVPEGLL
ncbi:MAG: ribosome maturation factor RimM [Firmicutes bacterium]|nr:ribosome maturation factor RimM [Bacillota bacterium]